MKWANELQSHMDYYDAFKSIITINLFNIWWSVILIESFAQSFWQRTDVYVYNGVQRNWQK